MSITKMQTSDAAGLMLLVCSMGWANVGMAQVNLTFESPPYTTGAIVGQDGWVYNNYATPAVHNGTADVSSISPLDGAQSLLFTQTSELAGGLSDISKAAAITVQGGRVGSDLNVSYLMKGTSNPNGAPHAGVYLSTDAANGSSPIFAKILNGGFLVGGTPLPGAPTLPSYFDDDLLEIRYDVDFDTTSYTLSIFNISFGQPGVPDYSWTYNYGAFAPEGSNVEYVVDVGAILRSGTISIDKLSLVPGTGPFMDVLTWANNASGNWNSSASWTPAGIPGTIPGRQVAAFGSAITSPQTVYTTTDRTLNRMEFDNANAYAITGAGVISFQADTSQSMPVLPVIQVESGSHQIQTVVSLLDNTTVTALAGASLDFNNEIDLGGKTLTLSGSGDININHSTTGGGTVMNLGTLAAEDGAEIGGDLVSVGTLSVSADESGADQFTVLGDATLSGTLDVEWDRSSLPTGTMTILSAAGELNADDIMLDPSDARSFALAVSGSDLTLTFLGVAVPEPTGIMLCLTGFASAVFIRRARHARSAFLMGLLALVALPTGQAHAQLIDFETPRYTAGSIVNQDGWVANVYPNPTVLNGTIEISTNSPLAGSQSLLYTQTSATGLSDINKPFVGFGTRDGTTAVDFTTSFQIQAGSNSFGTNQVGVFLTGFLPASPIGLRLNGGAIDVLGANDWVFNAASYTANNTLEFQVGVNFDNSDYEVAYRDITAGAATFTPIVGPGAGGRFPFLGGAGNFPTDGDGITHTVDVATFFRRGTGRIDNITVVGDDFVAAQWAGGSGNWSTNTSWIPQLVPNTPTGNAQVVTFGTLITSPQSVFSNTTQTVNGLRFDNANKYAIGGNGSIALKSNTVGGTVAPIIDVLNGSHELQLAVSLLNNTAVTTTSTGLLDFNNTVNLGGNTLTNSGTGTINLNVGVTGGGSIVNSGTLGTAGTTPIAANLTSTGKLLVDLGASNTDFFNITGNATVSGLLDVVLEPGYTPAGTYTVLTASGTLNAAGLALDPSDAGQFSLGVSGKSLVLTVSGGLAGDFDNDGDVDGRDFLAWQRGSSPNPLSASDLADWQAGYGSPLTAEFGATTAVPEPATLLIAFLSTVGLCCVRPRKSCFDGPGRSIR
jgi:hypothetical protein